MLASYVSERRIIEVRAAHGVAVLGIARIAVQHHGLGWTQPAVQSPASSPEEVRRAPPHESAKLELLAHR